MPEFPYRFCLITDFRFIPDNNIEHTIEKAITGGVDLVQYRDKGTAEHVQLKRAKQIKKVTSAYDAGLIVNGSVRIAREVEAEGIQIGLPSFSAGDTRAQLKDGQLIGVSVHNREDILSADHKGADFVLLSPFFKPGSKMSSLPPLGEKRFSSLCALTRLPVFALGGITAENAHIPCHYGARGIACITALLCADNIYETAKKIKKML